MNRPHAAREAYQKVDFDARVAGAEPRQLVGLCFEQFHSALGRALWAHQQHDNALKSRSLTRGLSALTALELGVTPDAPLGEELLLLYRSARTTLLDSVLSFDSARLAALRNDLADVARALAQA